MLPTATKQQAIYLSLKEQILNGTLPPGQRLIIQNIADESGLSTIPVREALQLLEADRLVEIRPHAGASVAAVAPGNIDETFTILEGMEAMAVRRVAALEPSEAPTDKLRQLIAEMDVAEKAGEEETWCRLNMQFHIAISDATNMPWLREITEEALVSWDRIRRFFFQAKGTHRFAEAQNEHHALLAALEARDPDQAEKIVRQHNRRASEHYTTRLQTERS